MSLAVTDSQALIWRVVGPQRKLGRRALNVFERADRGEAVIYIPALALVEVAEASRRGCIRLDPTFGRWAERLLATPRFLAADLTPAIVLKAESLYAIPERTDRLIAATALHLELPLITNDPDITAIPGLATIW